MQLYYSPMSIALAPHIALEEAGAMYEPVRVDFSKGEQQGPAYLAINAKGRVPALVTPRGVLTETPALLVYIAETHPAARLAPLDDPFKLAQLQAFNSYLASTVHVAFAHRGRGTRWATEEASLADMRRKVPGNVRACFELIEKDMLAGPWVMGDQYTVGDAYLFTLASWLSTPGVDVDIASLPAVADHFHRMAARPAVQRVMKLHKPS